MFDNKDLDAYYTVAGEIPHNIKFETIDGFGDAVKTIKEAVFSEIHEDVDAVMAEAVRLAFEHIHTKRHTNNQGYTAWGRFNHSIYIDDLELAALEKYLPKRLFNFLGGFQAEYNISLILPSLISKGYTAFTGNALDLHMKSTHGVTETVDKMHHIDLGIEYGKKLYLIHIYKDSYKSKNSLKDKLKSYMDNKKVMHITKDRHGLTYTSYRDITFENIQLQLKSIFKGDRVIQIKKNGTVQFNDFE